MRLGVFQLYECAHLGPELPVFLLGQILFPKPCPVTTLSVINFPADRRLRISSWEEEETERVNTQKWRTDKQNLVLSRC